MSPNTVALWCLMGDGCVLQRLQNHQSPTHPDILWGLCGLGVLQHHQDHIAGFKEMLIRRFFSAADGQLEARPVDEERPLPRAVAKENNVRMSVECGPALVSAMVLYQYPIIILQNMGCYDNLSTQKSTNFYMWFPEASSQVNSLHLSTVDTGLKKR